MCFPPPQKSGSAVIISALFFNELFPPIDALIINLAAFNILTTMDYRITEISLKFF
jgi:hypothetical protein